MATVTTPNDGDVKECEFGAPMAARLAGISYRQIDHWDRTGVLQPSVRQPGGSGTSRVYNAQDVLVLAVLRELSRMGVHIVQLGISTGIIREAVKRGEKFLVISPGGQVEACDDQMVALAMQAHDTVACWVLNLQAIVTHTEV